MLIGLLLLGVMAAGALADDDPFSALSAVTGSTSTDTSGDQTTTTSTVAAAPTISSDKRDYNPGGTVVLTGENWAPGETVHVNVNDNQTQSWSRDVDLVADAEGKVTDEFVLPDLFVATYDVTATAPSGRASSSFTDSSISLSPTSGAAGSSVSVSGNGFDKGVTLTVTFDGASVGTCQTSAQNGSFNNCTFTVPAGKAPGGYSVSATQGNGNGDTRTFTVTAPTDTTPPVITPTVTPASPNGSNGWYKTGNVTVSFTVTDPDSAITTQSAACSATTTVSTDGTTGVTCSATSAGGTSSNTQTIKRDVTVPLISIDSSVPTSTTSSSVTVTGTASDATSGVSGVTVNGSAATFAPLTQTYSRTVALSCGGNTLAAVSTDQAGNVSSTSQITVTRACDTTAPVTSATGNAGAYGDGTWTNGNVTVALSATDASGVASITYSTTGAQTASATTASGSTASVTITAEGSTTVSFHATDTVGNVESPDKTFVVRIDKTAPAASASAVSGGSPYAADTWTNHDVVVSYECTDGGSGVASTPGDDTVSGESATGSASGTCVDNAGNTATATFSPIKIDKTAPVITDLGPTSDPNAALWYNHDVVNRFGANYALSGLNADCVAAFTASGGDNVQSQTTSGEGTSVKVSSDSCTDVAGNTAAAIHSHGFRIDERAPFVSYTSQSPDANGVGWNNTDVKATFTATDSLSGFGPAGDPTTTGTKDSVGEGDSVSVESPAFTDAAGNTAVAGAASHAFKIDKTKPVIADLGPTSDPNAALWYDHDVVNRFGATDALSGLNADCVAAFPASGGDNVQSQTTSGEGLSINATSTSCTDVAGNTAAAIESHGFKIDKTKPVIAFNEQSPAKNSYGWNKVDVTLSWSCADSLSGPISTTDSAVVTSEGQHQQATGTCTDAAGNSASSTDGDVNLDKTKPVLNVSGAASNTSFNVCSLPARPTFSPVDALSGLDGTQTDSWLTPATPSGVGMYTYTATATDKAGNAITESRTYQDTYGTAAVAQVPFLQPINTDGTSRFKLGSTIPVKFKATCNGVPVSTVVAKMYVKQGDNNPDPGVDEAISTSAATTGNLFRWSGSPDNQYIFNLSTKLGYTNPDNSTINSFAQGSWTLKIGLDDGTFRSVIVQLAR
ncbi:MAG TPA: PxKF domain-containing protein [Gaiellaceae bacterium]|nr:PxKF domain-containing protein [Gaiellaceae bacterium]